MRAIVPGDVLCQSGSSQFCINRVDHFLERGSFTFRGFGGAIDVPGSRSVNCEVEEIRAAQINAGGQVAQTSYSRRRCHVTLIAARQSDSKDILSRVVTRGNRENQLAISSLCWRCKNDVLAVSAGNDGVQSNVNLRRQVKDRFVIGRRSA